MGSTNADSSDTRGVSDIQNKEDSSGLHNMLSRIWIEVEHSNSEWGFFRPQWIVYDAPKQTSGRSGEITKCEPLQGTTRVGIMGG